MCEYTAKDYKKGQPRWCPGCGDHFFLASLHKAMAEIGKAPWENAVISGIGCSSRLPYYMNTYAMQTIHGRAAAISTGAKVAKIPVPDVEVQGCADDADLLIVGFGGTYGHLYSAMEEMNKAGKKVALAHFTYLNPLPKNTETVLKKYKKVVVAEQNLGQFAGYLRMKIDNFTPYQFNEVKGQPFVVAELVAAFNKLIDN